MNTNRNSYTIIYAAVLVAVVSTVLALISLGLKERQQTNIDVEKQLNILNSAGSAEDAAQAKDKNAYVQEAFAKDIVAALVVNARGEVIRTDTEDLIKSEAFAISPAAQYDIMRKIESAQGEQKEALLESLRLPVFVGHNDKGDFQILSCYGSGLWGPIWGYLAVNDSFRELCGSLFDHKSETPGLGGEIATEKFRTQFVGKVIFEGGELTPVKVVKGGAKDAAHEIDALSGATITSTAVQDMVSQWLKYYEPYLKSRQAEAAAAAETQANDAAETEVVNDNKE